MLAFAPRLAVRSLPRAVPALRVAPAARRTLLTSAVRRGVSTRYTAEHEWVRFDDASNVGTIGITDYAQNSLGDVVFVELPAEGSQVKMGEQIGSVESVKAASDIYSPVSGVVESVNTELGDQPGLLNKSPLENGWLCQIKLANPSEFTTLLDEAAYKALCEDA
ncbi:hypothetical protein FA09DRAFT_335982 [Tilletiopsis washingtonensis]|uniref:Glycine cleavage system H protein n=1 Tax=Tilletiopsis washingtonensis TaxID=58919 RepID=A0A316ZIK7_9BASI|nr:hypothetical protein FA09DRAFT_335982 [Tilletiopsis washingtonensis]PWO01370.1 hypothetical protein FA09DRAFT_335982 [Tilletiopsis washingtonensis]